MVRDCQKVVESGKNVIDLLELNEDIYIKWRIMELKRMLILKNHND